MAKYRIDSIAGLARQMGFTPNDARLAQLTAAEDLLHSIQPAKAYPLDFIVFKITGYRTKDVDQTLLTGLALQHDLGLLIEDVSESLDLQSHLLTEPVLDIDDVCARFSVTSKTIQRWRRKGLPGRRFIFPDGKRRVGFLVSSVERFFATHKDQVERGTNFSQISNAEREDIVRRARRLAVFCHCCVNEIARRVARRLNRSPLTILHTLRKHDEDRPAEAVFPLAADAISDEDRQHILRGYKRGVAIRSLAKRMCRPRTAVYRVILTERIDRVQCRKIKFIDDTLYHQPDAGEVVNTIVANADLAIAPVSVEASRTPRDLPPFIAELYAAPLLTPARERALFLKFNFHKFEFVSARLRLDPELARARDLNLMETHLRRAGSVKREIVRTNLRLVASVARKHLRAGLTLSELISDGTITLMRAVEGFDLHKGNRFSTYATFALMKGFARSVPQMLAQRSTGRTDTGLVEIADRREASRLSTFLARDEVSQLLESLDSDEADVLRAHYGLDTPEPATYDQVAERMGLTRQRVRQIEQLALEKLRRAMAAKVG